MDDFICKEKFIHEDQIRRVREKLAAVSLDAIAETLKSLSDGKRLRILLALYWEEKLCVCDFSELLQCSMAAASHHLCYLADRQLVSRFQEGKFVYYALADPKTRDILKLLVEK
ncbi:ArsR/SmtB family transcription factor [Caproiciproducens sp. NJN-50]|uniref:ArsR/SmtB family transcription factor n=1 Tax=Caproiciproducens sp. NJN-50 TaxID=2507162 RepID=UPI0013E8F3AA|nr:metalloregulator ArsR/SmtB family transcription factor [Caproiciproducens sp. NJN-50]